MSHMDYKISQQLASAEPPFYALIMTAMRRADSDNIELLKAAFPEIHAELMARYHSPGGYLKDEAPPTT